MKKEKFYITTPIYYVNDKPHIGHAYTTIACDVMARFKRLDGYDVKFLTGTDEHGQKVAKSAETAGVSPKEFTDRMSLPFRELATNMNCSHDDFIRTTEARHLTSTQAIWKKLEENGHIYLGSYAGWYSVRDEAFYAESELIEGMAPTGAPVEWVEEPSYFFRLSAWQEPLLKFYAENQNFVLPDARFNEVKRFVEGGLKDLSISRTSFDWGVPVPGDEKHVMYVWLDALTNYITALGYPDTTTADWAYWQERDAHHTTPAHVVGKDILRFHAVYWPAFLMAADILPPSHVIAHGWWTNEGQKISKSLGNVIDPYDLVQQYGLDQTRYYMLREVPFGNDGNFSHESMVMRMNGDLANNLGNLGQRTLSMIAKNCGGTVPTPPTAPEADDTALINHAYEAVSTMRSALEVWHFHHALGAIEALGNAANTYIDTMAPWKLRKENPERMQEVLWTLAETLRCLGILLQPIVPEAAEKLLDQLAIAPDARDFTFLGAEHALKAGVALPAPNPIFPRYVEEEAA